MNKLFTLSILVLFLSIGIVSAGLGSSETIIQGHVYQADGTTPVAGAQVNVTCDNNHNHLKKTTITSLTGIYAAMWEMGCTLGSKVNVTVYDPVCGTGFKDGIVYDNAYLNWDVILNGCLPPVPPTPVKSTIINGIIYDENTGLPVSGADVWVNCNGNMIAATSESDGFYSASYDQSLCTVGNPLSVSASKGSLTGSNTGTIHSITTTLNLGVVNVALVPEFSTIIAGLTLISSLGIFFAIRRQ